MTSTCCPSSPSVDISHIVKPLSSLEKTTCSTKPVMLTCPGCVLFSVIVSAAAASDEAAPLRKIKSAVEAKSEFLLFITHLYIRQENESDMLQAPRPERTQSRMPDKSGEKTKQSSAKQKSYAMHCFAYKAIILSGMISLSERRDRGSPTVREHPRVPYGRMRQAACISACGDRNAR